MKKKGDFQPTKGYVDYYCELYKQGKSSNEIAKMFGLTQGGVGATLRRRKIMREALGRDIERATIILLKKMGHNVIHQKGDCVYDALVDGHKINIKSAHPTINEGKERYVFDIHHKDSKYTNFKKDYEQIYLVFLNGKDNPIYSIETKDIEAKRTLTITNYNRCKYKLSFITNYQ